MPAVIAVVFGVVVVLAGLVPWAAVQYRRRGVLGVGVTVIAAAAVVYALAIVSYTLLPLPADTAALCTQGGTHAQLRLFTFVDDIRRTGGLGGVTGVLRNPAAAQVLFNVVLFVPLGMFVRYFLARGHAVRGVLLGTVSGLLVSGLVEFTQLTGDWFLYPCSYRLFDVDDLLANTVGAFLGACVAPLLRLVPGQHREDRGPEQPRAVTVGRRLLGMVCDVLLVGIAQLVLATSVAILTFVTAGREASAPPWLLTLVSLLPAVAMLAALLTSGRTLGERVVRITPSSRPRFPQLVARWALGVGGWSVLNAIDVPGAALVAGLLVVGALVGVFLWSDRRGFAAGLAGISIGDDRAPALRDATR